jgi:RNA polymerase sigma-70 factor (ECF subfamily)
LLKNKDDGQLAARLKGRDTQALREIIRRYGNYVAAVARNTLFGHLRREDLEELCADVFEALWRSVPELKPGASLRPWLAVVARNKAYNWARVRHVTEVSLSDPEQLAQLNLLEQEIGSSRWDEDWEAADELANALKTLDEKSRDILTRHYYLQQSIREIANDTDSTEASVKTRLHRSRRNLRDCLERN